MEYGIKISLGTLTEIQGCSEGFCASSEFVHKLVCFNVPDFTKLDTKTIEQFGEFRVLLDCDLVTNFTYIVINFWRYVREYLQGELTCSVNDFIKAARVVRVMYDYENLDNFSEFVSDRDPEEITKAKQRSIKYHEQELQNIHEHYEQMKRGRFAQRVPSFYQYEDEMHYRMIISKLETRIEDKWVHVLKDSIYEHQIGSDIAYEIEGKHFAKFFDPERSNIPCIIDIKKRLRQGVQVCDNIVNNVPLELCSVPDYIVSGVDIHFILTSIFIDMELIRLMKEESVSHASKIFVVFVNSYTFERMSRFSVFDHHSYVNLTGRVANGVMKVSTAVGVDLTQKRRDSE